MKIGLLLSIRNKSTRFPGKVLKSIHGQTCTEHLIDRLLLCREPDQVIIATSDDPRDAVFKKMAENKKIECFLGDPVDKLSRYLQVANEYKLDGVVIVDGDDILCFPEIIDKTCVELRKNQSDVVFWKNLPLGAASSGLSKQSIETIMETKDEVDTEVWGGYFTTGDRFKVKICESEETLYCHPEIRMTMDYEEDYIFFKAIYDELYSKNHTFSSLEVMDLLINRKPKLSFINKAVQKKYEENIKKAPTVKFK